METQTLNATYFSSENVTESSNITSTDNIEDILLQNLGARRKDLSTVVILTSLYLIIFITGLLGNISTCTVIWKNQYMHTATNFYLLNLAVSDVLTLLIALPPEVFSIWEAYPWRFGETFCILKSYVMELTSYSSVLTITCFTIERYLSICHTMKYQHKCLMNRAKKCICVIWAVSGLSALPYPVHTRSFYYLSDPRTGLHIPDSLVCNIPHIWTGRMLIVFQLSTFGYFIIPMSIITLMYILIGVKLKRSEISTHESRQYGKSTSVKARRAILKMLVAVVVAFFLCWAPFHAQRLMTLYIKQWTPALIEAQEYLFYASGLLYFVSSTVNPILYNVLCKKFRIAFKRTMCRCLLKINTLPSLYKLKAKFKTNHMENEHFQHGIQTCANDQNTTENEISKRRIICYRFHGPNTKSSPTVDKPSTKETTINKTSRKTSYSSHAHSDGELHALCRHKWCASRKHVAFKSLPISRVVASSQEMETLRKPKITYVCFQHKSER
ncbi:pyrokinin-1 receptor-like [Dreissena polymorpha]|uniref:pyrokinin-1 receptor-like n=1 Tax=Dreissena polymorpha TaxID=45954 RepID=UPI002263F8AF|nr:pyrokinin-1 receptor-like [Dreissena polymorpha]